VVLIATGQGRQAGFTSREKKQWKGSPYEWRYQYSIVLVLGRRGDFLWGWSQLYESIVKIKAKISISTLPTPPLFPQFLFPTSPHTRRGAFHYNLLVKGFSGTGLCPLKRERQTGHVVALDPSNVSTHIKQKIWPQGVMIVLGTWRQHTGQWSSWFTSGRWIGTSWSLSAASPSTKLSSSSESSNLESTSRSSRRFCWNLAMIRARRFIKLASWATKNLEIYFWHLRRWKNHLNPEIQAALGQGDPQHDPG
jgi:hypothetical protein